VNYGALFRSALVALLRNKMRSVLTVLGIDIHDLRGFRRSDSGPPSIVIHADRLRVLR
jgi:hypothetical protein